jgi:hypothetical protein
MTFADLKPGDVLTVYMAGSKIYTCRAKVLAHHGDWVAANLWNLVAGRWGTSIARIAPHRVAALPGESAPPLLLRDAGNKQKPRQ